jgi:hypothetical protein
MRPALLRLLLPALLGWAAAGQAAPADFRDSLAMFETGATTPRRSACDLMRGRAGEVSRFQIMPEVWRSYSSSRDYSNPAVAWTVAERILEDRLVLFRAATRREPTALEVYLLWNKPGHFEAMAFDLARVRALYRSRAERFANLHTRLRQLTVASR